MLQLWGRKNAYNLQKVLWLLAELQLEFEHHDVGRSAGELETAEFLALNPHARIPVLVDGGQSLWESNSILRYLAASYDGSYHDDDNLVGNNRNSTQFLPSKPLARARVECWMDWELSKLQPDFIDLFWSYYRQPPAARNSQRIELARERCAKHFELLDRHLQHQEYLAGDFFSVGDISVATGLFRYFNMGLDVPRPPNLMLWYQRLGQRPAYQQTIMLRFDELKGRVNY